ncbi:MAG: FecR domain-containing protein [Tannerellaceae bacterium]
MEDDYLRKIIDSYFGKHFSAKGRFLFGRWLRSKEFAVTKNLLLHELWQQSSAEISNSTYEDWEHLQKSMATIPERKQPPFFASVWMKYAAVVAFLLLVGSNVYLLTDKFESTKEVDMTELFVPYGESRTVVLPDGTHVSVNPGSLLVYPTVFDHMHSRKVYLTGEATFNVHKDPEKPFIVKTTYLDVEALGTIFTVQAYSSDLFTTAMLEEGSVRVDVKTDSINSSILKPYEQLVYSRQNGLVNIQAMDTSLYEMEKNGYQIFENASFSYLISSLERKYNVVVHYNSQKYASYYSNVKFAPNESLENVLIILQQLIGFQYKQKDNVIFIN